MKSFGITDKGKVRSENQDSYIIENCDKRKCVIAVICDGMGGAKAGDLASRLSSKEFVSRVYESLAAPRLLMGNIEKLLRDSCADANGVVYEYSRFDANYSGMGTTLGRRYYNAPARPALSTSATAAHITFPMKG